MQKMRLTEFVNYSRENRLHDIKFRQSDKVQAWNRLPAMTSALLYNK